jgi:hypothetical protein
MNHYEQRQADRKERQADRAERLRSAASGAFRHAASMIEGIPPGQPILVGHHSERGHRRALEKHDRWMRKGVELQKLADEAARRSATVSHAISSDDPDAIDKLREKLAKLERMQEAMKAGNKIVRSKKLTDDEKVAELVKLGLRESTAREALKPDFCGRYGFPSYAISNNNAEIRRCKERIAAMERRATEEERPDTKGPGLTIREDRDDNRLLLIFPGKPAEAVRSELKSHGFRWSPDRGAWCRQLNNSARFAASVLVKRLAGAAGD